MKYEKIIEKINNKQNKTVDKEKILGWYYLFYKNYNNRTFENMIAYLKINHIMTELEKDKYIAVTKPIYKYNENNIDNRIYKLLNKEYSKMSFIVWNTELINEFTQHYVMKNYTIVEVEKEFIELFIILLKENLPKKFTVVTQDILINNRDLFANDENVIVVKSLRAKSPLDREKNKERISIEKMMVDLYIDKLYIYYQGKELQRIYENIFEKYNVNMKRLINYAKLRTNIETYKEYLNKLNIPKIYKC